MATDTLSDRQWLLLPGTLCTGAVFDPFLDALGVSNVHRRVVALDRPATEDYGDVFEAVTPDTVVCGFSLGAIVAAYWADRVLPHAFVLFGLNPYADDPAKALGRQALQNDVQARGGAAALSARMLDVYGPAPDATRAAILAMADETAPLIAAQTQLALSRPSALPALAACAAPVFCVTGSHDVAAPPVQGQDAADRALDGRFWELEGLGHFALIEDPKTCAKAVRSLYQAHHACT